MPIFVSSLASVPSKWEDQEREGPASFHNSFMEGFTAKSARAALVWEFRSEEAKVNDNAYGARRAWHMS